MNSERLDMPIEEAPKSQNEGRSDYPPFDPRRAEWLAELARSSKEDTAKDYRILTAEAVRNSNKETTNRRPQFDQSLYSSESEWQAAHSESANKRRESSDPLTYEKRMKEELRSLLRSSGDRRNTEGAPAEQTPAPIETTVPPSTSVEDVPVKEREADNIPDESDEGHVSDVMPSSPEQSSEEILSVTEVQSVYKLLNEVGLNVERIVATAKGSRSAEEAAGVLKSMFQRMKENSSAMVSSLQNESNLGNAEISNFAYEEEMSRAFRYSMQELKALHDKAKTLPPRIATILLFDIQQTENNLLMANNIASRRRRQAKRDQAPVLPKEKLVADDRESQEYLWVPKSR